MLSHPVVLPLCVSVLYGVASLLMKVAMNNGASHMNIIFFYAASCMTLALLIDPTGSFVFGKGLNFLLTITIGVMLAVAFWFIGLAYTVPNASPAMIMAVVATYPLVTAAFELYYKISDVDPIRLSIGAVIIFVGILVVASAEHKVVAAQ